MNALLFQGTLPPNFRGLVCGIIAERVQKNARSFTKVVL